MFDQPRISCWIGPGIAFGFVCLLYWAFSHLSPGTVREFILLGLTIAGFIAGLATAVNFVWWNLEKIPPWLEQLKKALYTSPQSVLADAVSKLTPEQIKLIPAYSNKFELDYELAEDGPLAAYRTPLGPIPMEFFVDLVRGSNNLALRPIRWYNDHMWEDWSREMCRDMYNRAVSVLLEKRLILPPSNDNEPPPWYGLNARANALVMMLGKDYEPPE